MDVVCIKPSEIEDIDLLAYIDGEASPTIAAHVAACRFCQQEVEGFLHVDLLLRQAAYRNACPESDVLWQYANDQLAQTQRQSLRPHIDGCAYCQQNLSQLRAAAYDPSSPASPVEPSAAYFLTRIQETGKEILQAIIQPPLSPPTLALRGEAGGQAVYRVGAYQIVLSKEAAAPKANTWQIEGQIINEDEPHASLMGTAVLIHNDEIITRTDVDDVGYFQIVKVSPGQYNVYIELADILLSFSDLTIP